jgi:hypothetical protein
MKLMHDTEETAVRQSWLGSRVVALARRTITQIGLPLPGMPRVPWGAVKWPGAAPRPAPPPFADTEASWHTL